MRRLICGGSEVHVTQAAASTTRYQHALADLREIGNDSSSLGATRQSAGRHPQDKIATLSAMHLLGAAIPSRLRGVVRMVMEIY
jgi:hypothetical protein